MDLEAELNQIVTQEEERISGDIVKKQDVWLCERCKKTFEVERGKRPKECEHCGKDVNHTSFKAKSGPYRYFENSKGEDFVPFHLGRDIKNSHNFFVHPESDEIYNYEDGIYDREGEKKIRSVAQDKLHNLVRNNYIKETIEYIRRCGDIRPDKDQINAPKHKIVVDNGFLDLRTRDIQRKTPKQLHTFQIPWEYDPDAGLGMIEDFLHDIVKDEDVKLLQEMFGYCLYKGYPVAKAFMLHGPGANGKSTLLNLLEKFLGPENVATPSLHDLLYDKFSKIELYGKLANIHSDISGSELSSTGTFKMLTGGDTIEGQRKYKDPVEFKNFAKLIYACNNLPSTEDTTKAFFRRWILIDFPYVFDEHSEKTDPNIIEKLITPEQMSGLLNWALDGLERVLNSGKFSTTDTRKNIEEKWLRQSDSLKSFFSECVDVEIDHWISKKDLRKAYKAYCENFNLEVESKTRMTKKGPEIVPRTESPNNYRPEAHDGSRVHAWKNIKLNERFYDDVDFAPQYTSEIKAQIDERQNQLEVVEE